MQLIRRILRQGLIGAGVGIAAILVALPFGFAGGPGYHREKVGLVLAIMLIILLVSLGALTISTGRILSRKLTDEERNFRNSLVPLLFATSVIILIAYLLIQPPPVTGP